MKNNTISEMAMKSLKKVIDYQVEKTVHRWPPICTSIYHQPKRPKHTN